jgi:hypothetical protein
MAFTWGTTRDDVGLTRDRTHSSLRNIDALNHTKHAERHCTVNIRLLEIGTLPGTFASTNRVTAILATILIGLTLCFTVVVAVCLDAAEAFRPIAFLQFSGQLVVVVIVVRILRCSGFFHTLGTRCPPFTA